MPNRAELHTRASARQSSTAFHARACARHGVRAGSTHFDDTPMRASSRTLRTPSHTRHGVRNGSVHRLSTPAKPWIPRDFTAQRAVQGLTQKALTLRARSGAKPRAEPSKSPRILLGPRARFSGSLRARRPLFPAVPSLGPRSSREVGPRSSSGSTRPNTSRAGDRGLVIDRRPGCSPACPSVTGSCSSSLPSLASRSPRDAPANPPGGFYRGGS